MIPEGMLVDGIAICLFVFAWILRVLRVVF